MSDAYKLFLASADVRIWSECLGRLSRAAAEVDNGDERLPELFGEALCVAIYLGWLARMSGDDAVAAEATDEFDRLSARLAAVSGDDSPRWRQCWALVLANADYTAHAAELLRDDRPWPAELTVLLVRGDDVAKLKELRQVARGITTTGFLPAVSYYAEALMNVGSVQEALRVLDTAARDNTHPLLLGLRGKIHEGLGQWSAAYDAYRRSSWPDHRFQAAVVGTIAGRSSGFDELADQMTPEVVLRYGGQLDQADVRRGVAFLNACRWRPVKSWVLELELGGLAFRRLQYAEADAHLSRALKSTPPGAQFAVAYLRFLDLTWLTGDGPEAVVDLTAESFTAADQLVGLDGDDARTPPAQLWLAKGVPDLSRLPASIMEWPAHDRADALDALGLPAHAIDASLMGLGTSFYHRTVVKLINRLWAAGLHMSAEELTEIVLRESADGFALWETCLALQALPTTGQHVADGPDGDGTEDWLTVKIEAFRERLGALGQAEFTDTVRALGLAVGAGDGDGAEELLLRASEQADAVSELIAVAILRRQSSFRSRQADQESLRCLHRARTIARDRLERLAIARELFRYRDVRAARQVLVEEQVLLPQTMLTHSEFVVALECSPWCTDEERQSLARRARERIAHDAAADVLGPYPQTYAQRLLSTLTLLDAVWGYDPPMADDARKAWDDSLYLGSADRSWDGEINDVWPEVQEQLSNLDAPDEEPNEPGSRLDELTARSSFGLRLLVVTELRDTVNHLQQEIKDVTPRLARSEIPISRWHDDTEAPRVIELCDLWRSRITGTSGADAELRDFLATERELEARWDERRRAASDPLRDRVARVAAALEHALGTLLGPDEHAEKHPVKKSLFAAVTRDIRRLSTEVAEQGLVAAGAEATEAL